MPGYKVSSKDFADIKLTYICTCCGLLLRDAVQALCGHHYCLTCMEDNILKFENPGCSHKGCSQVFKGKCQYFADQCVRREILDLTVSCQNNDAGCHWHDELRIFEDHVKDCPYQPIRCNNVGCNAHIPSTELAKHQEELCPFRTVVCYSCSSQVTITDHQDHLNICAFVYITCPNCEQVIQRHEFEKHSDPTNGNCPKKLCPFQEMGCPLLEKMGHDQLQSHLAENVVPHQLILLNKLKSAGDNCHQLYEDTATKQEALEQSLNQRIDGHDWALRTLYQKIMSFTGDVKKLVVESMFGKGGE